MNALKPPQNESDIISCLLLGTLGAMQSSSAFHGMWSMISAEGIFPFQWSLAGWPRHLEVRQADFILSGPMRWSQSARVRFAVRRRTSGCLPTQLPGDLTVGLTRAELKLKWKLKLESSDRV